MRLCYYVLNEWRGLRFFLLISPILRRRHSLRHLQHPRRASVGRPRGRQLRLVRLTCLFSPLLSSPLFSSLLFSLLSSSLLSSTRPLLSFDPCSLLQLPRIS